MAENKSGVSESHEHNKKNIRDGKHNSASVFLFGYIYIEIELMLFEGFSSTYAQY